MRKKQKSQSEPGAKQGLTKKEKQRIINAVGTVLMFAVLGLVLYAVMFRGAQRPSANLTQRTDQQQAAPSADPAAPQAPRAACPTGPGEPWQYDGPTDCYFDPSPGHAHWHQGQPPDQAERARRMAGPAPTPIPLGMPEPLPPPTGTTP